MTRGCFRRKVTKLHYGLGMSSRKWFSLQTFISYIRINKLLVAEYGKCVLCLSDAASKGL